MPDLIRMLADGALRSGEDIGRELGITRAAVWKRIQNIQRKAGYEIESIPGRGYRLAQPLELLDIGRLQKIAGPTYNLCLLDSVDSTNEHAKRLVKEGSKVNLVVSEEQTYGRGRRGRQWLSPYGCNLYLSLVWPVTEGMRQLEGLSLAVGLAVLRAITAFGVEKAGLKWPNDVLVGKEKIAGILLELVGDLADQSSVIIGIGINVNMQKTTLEIGQPWTSVSQCIGASASRHEVLNALLLELGSILKLQAKHGFSALRREWESKHLWQGLSVTLSSVGASIEGRITGINDRGELGIATQQGVEYFAGGELTLRLSDDS